MIIYLLVAYLAYFLTVGFLLMLMDMHDPKVGNSSKDQKR